MNRFSVPFLACAVLVIMQAAPVSASAPAPVPQPPARTVVPPAPDPGLPNYGVVWEPTVRAEDPALEVCGQAVYAAREASIRVVVAVDGEERVIDLPPGTVGAIVEALARAAPAPVLCAAPQAAVTQAARGPARISPQMPVAADMGVYRVQVGSFAATALAMNCFYRLRGAGFDPRFERFHSDLHGAMYRVVIPGVCASEMPAVAQRLGSAGFPEALVRREN